MATRSEHIAASATLMAEGQSASSLQAEECGESAAVEDRVPPDVAREHLSPQIVVPPVVARREQPPHATNH
jgi:hypothetical protein